MKANTQTQYVSDKGRLMDAYNNTALMRQRFERLFRENKTSFDEAQVENTKNFVTPLSEALENLNTFLDVSITPTAFDTTEKNPYYRPDTTHVIKIFNRLAARHQGMMQGAPDISVTLNSQAQGKLLRLSKMIADVAALLAQDLQNEDMDESNKNLAQLASELEAGIEKISQLPVFQDERSEANSYAHMHLTA